MEGVFNGMDVPPQLVPGSFVDNMEIDVEDSLALDHEAPTEKTDENFFNSALRRLTQFNKRCSQQPLAPMLSSRFHWCPVAGFDDDFDDDDLS